jgi:hypothetical protein
MQIVGIALVSLLALVASDLCADDPATTTPRRQYQAVLDDFVAVKRALASKFESDTTEEPRRELRAQFPGPEDYYGRLLALAQAHPGDAAAVDSLVWIVATSTNGYDAFKERGSGSNGPWTSSPATIQTIRGSGASPGTQLALPFRDAIDRLAAQVFGPWSSAGIVH